MKNLIKLFTNTFLVIIISAFCSNEVIAQDILNVEDLVFRLEAEYLKAKKRISV